MSKLVGNDVTDRPQWSYVSLPTKRKFRIGFRREPTTWFSL